MFTHTLKKLGIEVRYADPLSKNFEKLVDEKTRCFYAETLPNPYLRVFPIKEVQILVRKYSIPLIMDNTAHLLYVSHLIMVPPLLFIL